MARGSIARRQRPRVFWTPAAFAAIVPPAHGWQRVGVFEDLKHNSFYTIVRTWLRGELVGEDQYGNRYYREKGIPDWRRERRWVVYAREPEPTEVPPGWVGWLHKRLRLPPSEQPLPTPRWEKERLPNLTGTPGAFMPSGAVQKGGRRPPATGDYEAWRPE